MHDMVNGPSEELSSRWWNPFLGEDSGGMCMGLLGAEDHKRGLVMLLLEQFKYTWYAVRAVLAWGHDLERTNAR